MKSSSVQPTGHEQRFELHEAFFSVTDRRGIIRFGNDIFARTSGYSLEELVGAPHNLIRHPDVPRCVFRLLWDAMKEGKPFCGYVKNLAKNGNHYWVMALIEPVEESLVSIRIKPSSGFLGQIEALYGKALKAENEALANGQSLRECMDASTKLLSEALLDAGFADYETFGESCLRRELISRNRKLDTNGESFLRYRREGTSRTDERGGVWDACWSAYAEVGELFETLDIFLSMADAFESRKDFVKDLSEDFRLYALNANLACQNLGALTSSIGTVAQFLQGQAHHLAENAERFSTNLSEANRAILKMVSCLASARLELEMLLSFMRETGRMDLGQEASNRRLLKAAFEGSLTKVLQSVDGLNACYQGLCRERKELKKVVVSLKVAQVCGLTESARSEDAAHLSDMFGTFRSKIESAQGEVTRLEEIVDGVVPLLQSVPSKANRALRLLREAREPKEASLAIV